MHGLSSSEPGSGDVPKHRDLVATFPFGTQISPARRRCHQKPQWGRGSSSPKSHLSGSGAEFTPPTAGRPLHHSRSVWSAHWSDVFTARALGFVVDIPSLRAAVDDEDTWQQEYCCQFLSDAAHYLPLELVVAAEFSPLSTATPPSRGGELARLQNFSPEPPGPRLGELTPPLLAHESRPYAPCYLGVDIGRRHDKTVLWLLAEAGGILSTRSVQTLERAPFATQRSAMAALLSLQADDARGFLIQRCAIDSTGLGAMLAEELQSRFGARVEPVHFTLAVKEDLAVRLKRRLEERRLRIPYDPAIRRALGAVKRYTTPTGHFRFDAARTDEGHADEFWALALACYAADAAPLSTEFIPTQLPSAFSALGGCASGARLAHAF